MSKFNFSHPNFSYSLDECLNTVNIRDEPILPEMNPDLNLINDYLGEIDFAWEDWNSARDTDDSPTGSTSTRDQILKKIAACSDRIVKNESSELTNVLKRR